MPTSKNHPYGFTPTQESLDCLIAAAHTYADKCLTYGIKPIDTLYTSAGALHMTSTCEDTLARARSQHNFGLLVALTRRVQSLEQALDATCKVLADRDRGSELSAK